MAKMLLLVRVFPRHRLRLLRRLCSAVRFSFFSIAWIKMGRTNCMGAVNTFGVCAHHRTTHTQYTSHTWQMNRRSSLHAGRWWKSIVSNMKKMCNSKLHTSTSIDHPLLCTMPRRDMCFWKSLLFFFRSSLRQQATGRDLFGFGTCVNGHIIK